ncbi:hypothetical protein HanIR_Chr07g0336971 [Helianthus annuus]|nr:hypothetical protein HanIR_Chr07g0336971 [Helianthus annuus]
MFFGFVIFPTQFHSFAHINDFYFITKISNDRWIHQWCITAIMAIENKTIFHSFLGITQTRLLFFLHTQRSPLNQHFESLQWRSLNFSVGRAKTYIPKNFYRTGGGGGGGEETRSVKPDPSFHNESACKMLLHCRDFLLPDLCSCLEEGLTTLSVQHGNKSN